MRQHHAWTKKPDPSFPLVDRYDCECGAWTHQAYSSVWYSKCPLEPVYVHEAHCNTIHDGPQPCPSPRVVPEPTLIIYDRERDVMDVKAMARNKRPELTHLIPLDWQIHHARAIGALARLTLEAQGRFSYEEVTFVGTEAAQTRMASLRSQRGAAERVDSIRAEMETQVDQLEARVQELKIRLDGIDGITDRWLVRAANALNNKIEVEQTVQLPNEPVAVKKALDQVIIDYETHEV